VSHFLSFSCVLGKTSPKSRREMAMKKFQVYAAIVPLRPLFSRVANLSSSPSPGTRNESQWVLVRMLIKDWPVESRQPTSNSENKSLSQSAQMLVPFHWQRGL
jgi:hypothetical protein